MLASTSRVTRRAGCVHPASLRSLGAPGDALRRYQQTRGFRFGRGWGSYFESEPQQDDIYRRYRSFRYKYTEALGRRHDGQPLAEDAKSALRRIVSEHQHPRGGKRRWVANCRITKTESTPDSLEGVLPGQNIEDVERAPMEHLLYGDRPRLAQTYFDNWDVPLRNHEHLRRSHRTKHPKPDLSKVANTVTATEASPEYIIDPITNRKVPKGSLASSSVLEKGPDPPVESFRSYRSQFCSFRPPSAAASEHPTPPPSAALAAEPIPKLSSMERQPILESERYVAELSDAPASNLLDTLSEKQQSVFWHPSDVIAPPPSKRATWTLEPGVEAYLGPGNESLQSQGVTAQHSDLHQYEAVRHLEPNGKTAEQESVPKYDDLDKYEAFRSHEPDGKYKPEMPPVDPEELKLYKPFRSCEPDGKYAESYHEEKLDYSELAQYSQPFMSHEPDGKYAESYGRPGTEDAELPEYEPFRSHEPDGKYANKEGATVSAKELAGYASAPAHELDGKLEDDITAEPDSEELGKYKAFRSHEPNGKYAAEAESIEDSDLGGNHEAFGYEDTEVASSSQDAQTTVEASELRKYTAVRYNEPDGKPAVEDESSEPLFDYDLRASNKKDGASEKTHYRKMLETCMTQSTSVSDAIDADTSSSLKEKRAAEVPLGKPALTGNYVQDFPEEFAKSWSPDTYLSSTEAPEQVVAESSSVLEPALDRYGNKAESQESPLPTSQPTAAPVPTLYKVLVYDPTMQCIDVAETTSIVADSNTPLTPAEVLLRISNPAKFLPHFGPLQAQGFEIVSGAGDVLIFRKVREAVPEASQSGIANHTTAETFAAPTPNRPAINPIDMTGGPRDNTVAASRFASPTGFVNYDLPPPRFESNIDVHREEPVFSGSKEKSGNEGKKTSLPKRIALGALWVGAASYSVGVVGEYFKTGGADGKGPKGL
ncbi:hypothetical protein QBC34DRAFT_418729 [Podospora aff. communis PSN243]|uniref:Uncharacterized protein n=1 Tax=Podospora aff. communis PSN243 TaxID=3040156 RepID=A0AAV9G315_9PEZI|nr:hypothetical protein QBC34DRAFT_418729 [Podospora aff. communis PSN243]